MQMLYQLCQNNIFISIDKTEIIFLPIFIIAIKQQQQNVSL